MHHVVVLRKGRKNYRPLFLLQVSLLHRPEGQMQACELLDEGLIHKTSNHAPVMHAIVRILE